MYTTLIDTHTLAENLDNPDWVIIDCRFSLADPAIGRKWFTESHIERAVYAHLDEHLSSAPVTDNGRHPLPSPERLRETFGRFGITPQTQVVIYDQIGAVYAGRLWWMLHYMGHEAVAVLDGGWPAWEAGEGKVESGEGKVPEVVQFIGEPRRELLVLIDEVPAQKLLIDSRGAARYRGEIEPLDAVAGHIPNAINYFFQKNWAEDKRLLPPEQLAAAFSKLLGDTAPQDATFYCGSGVSACVNLLAMRHAGLPMGKLYVGSWSEWSRENN